MPKLVEPWEQGELDGLCGIYAIINAMKVLALSRGRQYSDADGAKLFKDSVRYLHKRNQLPHALWDGTSIMHVRDFLGIAKRFMRNQYELDIVWRRLAAPGEVTRKDVFWRLLDDALAARDELYDFKQKTKHTRVALLGLGHPQPHWTLAYGVGKSSIQLIDSGSRIRIRYHNCTVGESHPKKWMLEPEHTLIISTL